MNTQNTNDIQQKVLAKQVAILYKNLTLSIPANFICATVIFISLYQVSDTLLVGMWYGAVCLISALRLLALYFYLHNVKQLSFYLPLFIIGVILSASTWGFVNSFLMPDGNLIVQMIMVVITSGVTSGGLQSLQANLTASLLYVMLIIVPLCLWLLFQKHMAYLLLAIAMVAYLLFMLMTAKRSYHLLKQALALEYENLSLIESLSSQNAKLEEVYKAEEESKANLHTILDNAPIGMAIISLEGQFIQANHALDEIVGHPKAELENASLSRILNSEALSLVQEYMKQLLHGEASSYQFETKYLRKDGQQGWILVTMSLMRNKAGRPLYFISQIQDINERKQNEKELALLNDRTQSMLDELKQREYEVTAINKMNDMLQICQELSEAYTSIHFTAQELFPNLSGGITIFNKSTNKMETVKEWGEMSVLSSIFMVDDCWSLRAGYPYIIQNPKDDILCQHFTSLPESSYMCVPLMVQGKTIGMLYLQTHQDEMLTEHQQQLAITFSEVIKLTLANIKLRETLRDQAIHDPLTGLFNRRHLNEVLPNELHRVMKENSVLCIVMVDIDYFKQFNDTNGHDAGDEVLKFIGKTLKENISGQDMAFRYGGEEFLLILSNKELNVAKQELEKINLKVKGHRLSFNDKLLQPITLSMGLAVAPSQGSTASAIIRAADEALYDAKQNGRDRLVIYHSTSEVK